MGSIPNLQDPTYHWATKPMHHNDCACALKPGNHNPSALERVPHHKGSNCSKAAIRVESCPCSWQLEKGPHSNADPAQSKIKKVIKQKHHCLQKKVLTPYYCIQGQFQSSPCPTLARVRSHWSPCCSSSSPCTVLPLCLCSWCSLIVDSLPHILMFRNPTIPSEFNSNAISPK